MDIKFKVTPETFDEFFSIEEWINFESLSNVDIYEKMLCFLANSEGEIVAKEEARKVFKKIPKKQWSECQELFIKAINDAFVNPTNGGS